MDFKGFWLIDPTTGKDSVSLTLMVISFLALLVASALHLKHLTDNTSSLLELFYATSALYFGRRISILTPNNKSEISSDTKDKNE